MDMAESYVGNASSAGAPPIVETETTLMSSKSPLLTVLWGKEFPEGLYCPNTKCGCASVAAIQIFSYYQYPTYVTLDFPQRERNAITINWTNLKKHVRSSSSYASHTSCSATVDSHKTLAELARQCAEYGQSVFRNKDQATNIDTIVPYTNPLPYTYTTYTVWETASTGTTNNGIMDMIESMGYVRPSFSSYSSQCTKSYLNSNKPVYMTGTGSLGGHAWVVDGYKYYRDVTTYYYTEPATSVTTYRYYNHINWGWYGISNGYFLDGVFTANNAYQYDNTSYGTHSYSFQNSLQYAAIEH